MAIESRVMATPSSSSTRPTITVVYASATGTAHDLAHRIARVAQRHHFPVRIRSTNGLDAADISELGLVVFLVATAGNGHFPPTANHFWQGLLNSSLPLGVALSQLRFAVFGLGDSSYPKYCWPERMLRKRLVDLGAQEVLRGEGDEQHYQGIDGTFQPFLAELFQRLTEEHPLPSGVEVIPEDAPLPPSLALRLLDEQAVTPANGQAPSVIEGDSSRRWLRLVRNQRLTAPGHFQDVRLIELEVPRESEPDLDYEAGDIAALRPMNDPARSLQLLDRMGWKDLRDRRIQVWDVQEDRPVDLPPFAPPLPTVAGAKPKSLASVHDTDSAKPGLDLDRWPTLLQYVQYHISPFSPLRPSFFPLIRPFAADEREREKLDEYCTPGEGYEEAMEYAVRTRRTVWEVLDEFRSVRLPLENAAEALGGEMREREFSIASAPSNSRRSIQLLVAIVKYRTRIREPRRGVATRWLASLDAATQDVPLIPVTFRPSPILHLPPSETTPIIAVGPGTGAAPLRGLLLERIARGGEGAKANNNLIFLGCRSAKDDCLLGEEWQKLSDEGKVEVHWAFSRTDEAGEPRPPGQPRVYVQDVIRRNSATVWDKLSRGGWVYICGSSGKMPEAVRESVIDVVIEEGGLERDQAERFVSERLENQGRWREECWS